MDEKPRTRSILGAVIMAPAYALAFFPILILLAVVLYLRALVVAVVEGARYLFQGSHRRSGRFEPRQSPHFLDPKGSQQKQRDPQLPRKPR